MRASRQRMMYRRIGFQQRMTGRVYPVLGWQLGVVLFEGEAARDLRRRALYG